MSQCREMEMLEATESIEDGFILPTSMRILYANSTLVPMIALNPTGVALMRCSMTHVLRTLPA